MSITTVITAPDQNFIQVEEGNILTLKADAACSAVAYRLDGLSNINSLESYNLGIDSTVNIGPFIDIVRILIVVNAGSITATEKKSLGSSISSAVASVNMKVGDVQLTAADVGAQPALHAIGAVHFDGATQLTRAPMTGVEDGATGILSIWLRNPGNDQYILNNSNYDIEFYLFTGHLRVTLYARDQQNHIVFNAVIPTTDWVHLLMAWDMNHTSNQRIFKLAANAGLSGAITENGGTAPFTVDYAGYPLFVGSTGGTGYLNNDVAEVYFAPGQFLDLTVEANVRKFIDAKGYPVDLGANGELPTGIVPALYLSAQPGNEVTSFIDNKGTGGDFAVAGTLVAAVSSPTDLNDIGFANPMTTAGDLIIGGENGTAVRLANPGTGTFKLQSVDGVLSWVVG